MFVKVLQPIHLEERFQEREGMTVQLIGSFGNPESSMIRQPFGEPLEEVKTILQA